MNPTKKIVTHTYEIEPYSKLYNKLVRIETIIQIAKQIKKSSISCTKKINCYEVFNTKTTIKLVKKK